MADHRVHKQEFSGFVARIDDAAESAAVANGALQPNIAMTNSVSDGTADNQLICHPRVDAGGQPG